MDPKQVPTEEDFSLNPFSFQTFCQQRQSDDRDQFTTATAEPSIGVELPELYELNVNAEAATPPPADIDLVDSNKRLAADNQRLADELLLSRRERQRLQDENLGLRDKTDGLESELQATQRQLSQLQSAHKRLKRDLTALAANAEKTLLAPMASGLKALRELADDDRNPTDF
jgi:hypothetical protein